MTITAGLDPSGTLILMIVYEFIPDLIEIKFLFDIWKLEIVMKNMSKKQTRNAVTPSYNLESVFDRFHVCSISVSKKNWVKCVSTSK